MDGRGSQRVPISIRLGRRRTPSAIGVIERHATLPVDVTGIAISTFGKVIKRGWDWLGLTPAASAHISGLMEAPDLAACLTLGKNDFVRTGTRGASYSHTAKPFRRWSPDSSPSGAMRPTETRGRAASGWSGTSSACSNISPMTSRYCARWSIAAPEGKSGCRCRAGVMNVFHRRSSRLCPSVTNPKTEEAARCPRKAPQGNHPEGRPRHSRSRRLLRRWRRRPREIRSAHP